MRLPILRLTLVLTLTFWILGVTPPNGFAQLSNATNVSPATQLSRDDTSEIARRVMTTAELAIKASERALSFMMWLLGIFLGGSALGIAGLWVRLSTFIKNLRQEMKESQIKANKLLEDAGKTASVFEQVLRSLPIVFIDGIDENNKIVALNTLAQLRRSELAPIFAAFLRNTGNTNTQAAAVYALGLLGPDGLDSLTEILHLSHNPDYNLRRECARTLASLGAARREVRMRLEEMAIDVDQIVKEIAQKALVGILTPSAAA